MKTIALIRHLVRHSDNMAMLHQSRFGSIGTGSYQSSKHVAFLNISHAKICIPSSSGGHLTHMWMLKPIWGEAADRFWVTFDKEDANALLEGERVYHCYSPTNRNIPNLFRNTALAITVLFRERPDIVISSGAAVAVPFFLIGRLVGAKCVYVEVFDRIDKPTLTGRLLNRVSSLFVVQWPEQLMVYKRAVDLGSIF